MACAVDSKLKKIGMVSKGQRQVLRSKDHNVAALEQGDRRTDGMQSTWPVLTSREVMTPSQDHRLKKHPVVSLA
jgi:hypothetical protein